ncbi:MAG: hypothetical protein C0595_13380 [Marinilabiliales bacterium]|nr:MAG: hypothetical protein C0595_13380 [Marinilabiliales bacterium]
MKPTYNLFQIFFIIYIVNHKKSIISYTKIIVMISLILLSSADSIYAQLSGNYTIGPESSDYSTFTDAISDLQNQGLAGDITFFVKPGNYYNVNVQNIENDSAYNIVFNYDGTPNDSASIIGYLKVNNSPYVTFRGFSIFPAEGQETSCINASMSTYFTLDSCNILNIYNNEFDYDEGLILLDFPWDGPYYVANISNCKISSPEETIVIDGKKGSIWIRNNIITGFVSNTFNGGSKHWINNTFNLTDWDFDFTGQEFIGNTFYFNSIFQLRIKGNFFENEFYTDVDLTASNVTGNIFHDEIDMKWCNNANVTGNIFKSNFNSIYSHGIKVKNNIFNENVSFNNDNTTFGNNIIYDTVEFTHGPGQLIFNNNFHRNSRLELWYTGGVLKNNNIASLWIVPSNIPVWTIEFNNFIGEDYASVCCYGDSAYFFNPMYTDEDQLYTNNTMLIGKGGEFSSGFKYDIDSVERKNPCTIGANEVCFNWQVENIYLKCYDSVQLDLCVDTLTDMYWSPNDLFPDSTSVNPIIHPNDDAMIYLKDFDENIIDSLLINVEASLPTAEATYTIQGFTVDFNNISRCASQYSWDFDDGKFSTDKSPTHVYETGGSYNVILTAINSLDEEDYYEISIMALGINEGSVFAEDIKLYPNPLRSKLFVESAYEINGISIFTVSGKLVYKQTIENKRNFELNLNQLQDSYYVIKINTAQGIFIKKLIKINI